MTPRAPYCIRLAPEERAEIEARARLDGEDRSTSWARDALLATARRQPLMSGAELEALANAAEQLRAIGVNLNQLVRRSHMDTAERLWDAETVTLLFAKMDGARELLLQIVRRQDFSA